MLGSALRGKTIEKEWGLRIRTTEFHSAVRLNQHNVHLLQKTNKKSAQRFHYHSGFWKSIWASGYPVRDPGLKG